MLRIFYFEIHQAPSELLLPSAKKICPERLDWPSRLAGISEGAQWISKKNLDHFSSIFFNYEMVISRLEISFHLLKEF